MNPIRAARERVGLTRMELARAAACHYQTITHLEAGIPNQPPEAVLAVLARVGFAPEAIEAQYREWREEQTRLVLERVTRAV